MPGICWILYSLAGIFTAPALGYVDLQSRLYTGQSYMEFGSPLICPGEVRAFRCSAVESIDVGWIVREPQSELSIFMWPDDLPGVNFHGEPNARAHLESRVTRASYNYVGNRTSILRYTPVFNTTTNVNIECISEITVIGTTQLVVYGRDGIYMPFDVSYSINEHVIIYQWDHPTKNLVSHYILNINAPGLNGQLIQVNVSELRISYINNVSYSGTVRAISICGHTSDTLSFNGPTIITIITADETFNNSETLSNSETSLSNCEILRNNEPSVTLPDINRKREAGLCIGGVIVGIVISMVVAGIIFLFRGRKKTEPSATNSQPQEK